MVLILFVSSYQALLTSILFLESIINSKDFKTIFQFLLIFFSL